MWSYKDTFFADENKIAHCPCPRPRGTDGVNEMDGVDKDRLSNEKIFLPENLDRKKKLCNFDVRKKEYGRSKSHRVIRWCRRIPCWP